MISSFSALLPQRTSLPQHASSKPQTMHLQGSCHCQRVRFSLSSPYPYPYNHCYCSICRKLGGSGGFGINIGGLRETLEVEGQEHIKVYRTQYRNAAGELVREGPGERHFCQNCGSHLWGWDPRWPEFVYPYAGAIDTPLPTPPERKHMMLQFKASWVTVPDTPQDQPFEGYANETLAHWHDRHGFGDLGESFP
ncbi:MAG: GFA family protein [Prochlorothrix sp.]|nr:GFA family protein [Prochlorothrix sp.]